MATQTVRSVASGGFSSLDMKLINEEGTTEVDAGGAATQDSVVNTIWEYDFTDIPAGRYLVLLVNNGTIASMDFVTLTLTTGSFNVESLLEVSQSPYTYDGV